jgi:hypothetical protein
LKAELGMKTKKDEEEDDMKFCSLKVPMDHEDKDSKTLNLAQAMLTGRGLEAFLSERRAQESKKLHVRPIVNPRF